MTEQKPTVVQDVTREPLAPIDAAKDAPPPGNGHLHDSQPIEQPPPGGGQVKGGQEDV